MANVHGGNLHHIYADTEILSARLLIILWDRPFNLKGGGGGGGGVWLLVSFRKKISDNTRVRIFFFVARSANFFSRM